jgi:hypothetical protein
MVIDRWLVSLLCCCLVFSACTSLREVPLPAGAPAVSVAGIKPGDTVVITLRDGTVRKLEVEQVEAVALVGKSRRGTGNERHAYADMQALEVRRISIWKTTGAVAATVLVVALAALAVLIDSYSGE